MTDTSDEIAIVGGGPAGLMAAEVLAAAGLRVAIYDRMPALGRKLLLAGRGGLNLTHSEAREAFLGRYGVAADFLAPMLDAFPPGALAHWCEELGQEVFVGSSGRLFPKALKASPLLRAWLRRLDGLGVRYEARHTWIGWDEAGALIFERGDGSQTAIAPRATLLALGGASWPRLGADGGWVPILRAAGVEVRDLAPANSGCTVAWSAIFKQRFAGTPLKRVAVTCAGTRVLGEAMVTSAGIEGGAVYALTPQIRAAFASGSSCTLTLDLRPDISEARLAYRLGMPRGKQSQSNFLRKATGLSPVAISLLREGLDNQPLPSDPAALAARIKALPLTVTGVGGLARAISTAGGVALAAVDGGLMLRAKSGVFVAGEMLDWEAPTGGYLLQACFSTGRAAARGMLSWLGAPLPETATPDWTITLPASPAPADDASEPAP